tara:strand:+ start:8880 stop:9479 length:600 start_codon:yes stop_codon:yes gene_type:complete
MNSERIALETQHLKLNSFNNEDAKHVALLAGDKRIVEMTTSIPLPYTTEMAADWIKTHSTQDKHIFAIRHKKLNALIGCINIDFAAQHSRGYVGYWIGHAYWNKGYASEALKKIIDYGFSFSHINKIWAAYKTYNLASGRVMEKAGMTHEGVMRQHDRDRDGQYFDLAIASILKPEYVNQQSKLNNMREDIYSNATYAT